MPVPRLGLHDRALVGRVAVSDLLLLLRRVRRGRGLRARARGGRAGRSGAPVIPVVPLPLAPVLERLQPGGRWRAYDARSASVESVVRAQTGYDVFLVDAGRTGPRELRVCTLNTIHEIQELFEILTQHLMLIVFKKPYLKMR